MRRRGFKYMNSITQEIWNEGYEQGRKETVITLSESGWTAPQIAWGIKEDIEIVKKWLQQKDDIK